MPAGNQRRCRVIRLHDNPRAFHRAGQQYQRFIGAQIAAHRDRHLFTQPRKLLDITVADYEAVLDVSLKGTLLASQAVLPTMVAQNSGSIVCISSVSAQRGGGILGGPHYSAAKAGVLGLARAMARDFGPNGIRVNCVTPGLIATDINKGKIPEEKRGAILEGIPLGRIGEPADVAGCVTFLASDLAKYVTGVTLDCNGGMLIH